MEKTINMWKYLMLVVVTLMISGCGYMFLASPPKTSEVKDVIRLKSPRSEFIDVVTEIGNEDGYEIRKSTYRSDILDPSMGQPLSITLTSGGGPGDMFLAGQTGSARAVKIDFNSGDNGKTWNCSIGVWGNFSSGREDAALNFWSEFKPKLLKRLSKNFNVAADGLFANISSVRNSPIKTDNNLHSNIKADGINSATPLKTKKTKQPAEMIYIDKNGNVIQ